MVLGGIQQDIPFRCASNLDYDDEMEEDVRYLGYNKNCIDDVELDAISEIDDDAIYKELDYSQLRLDVENDNDAIYENLDYSELRLDVESNYESPALNPLYENVDDFEMKLDTVIMEAIEQFGIVSTTTAIENVLKQRDIIKLYKSRTEIRQEKFKRDIDVGYLETIVTELVDLKEYNPVIDISELTTPIEKFQYIYI